MPALRTVPGACALAFLACLGSTTRATAQAVDVGPPPDTTLAPAQPDFSVVNLPTTLRMPEHRFAFRVTHRFTRDLTRGGFEGVLADFFGLDGGAQVGLELRFGVARGWQAGIYRTSDRTIELFTQYNVFRRGSRWPVSIDALAVFEGTNNLSASDPAQPTGGGQRSPGLGTVASWVFGRTGSINATLSWVGNTNPLPNRPAAHDDTVVLGIGGRWRARPTVYLVAEVAPRVAGFSPGATAVSFGIEKRVGGHAFQLNFSNGIGSTLAQVARGTESGDAWFIGFNISRKFF